MGGHWDFSSDGKFGFRIKNGNNLKVWVRNVADPLSVYATLRYDATLPDLHNAHVSWPDAQPGWFVLGIFPNSPATGSRVDELLKVTATGAVNTGITDLVHTGTYGASGPTGYFWRQPVPSPSADGSKISFNSYAPGDVDQYILYLTTPQPPAAPSNLAATAVSSSTINLAWTDNATNETGFEIDRALNSAFTSGLVVNAYTTGANPTMPVPATGLIASTTYYFRVRATNANGDSASSNTANATTQGGGGAPEVNVTGAGITILDGDSTPQTADGTDFGSTPVAGGTVQKVFNIQNTGGATLTLGTVTATGNFSVISQPGASIAPGGNANFTVQFDPRGLGVRNGTVSFTNNDTAAPSESPYNFSVRGTGI